jgi:hypothetical protein
MHGHQHPHSHPHAPSSGGLLFFALALTLGFAAVEALAGWLTGSLALLGDAGHMLTDSTALALAAAAAWIARRPPSVRHSFGLGRPTTSRCNPSHGTPPCAWCAMKGDRAPSAPGDLFNHPATASY